MCLAACAVLNLQAMAPYVEVLLGCNSSLLLLPSHFNKTSTQSSSSKTCRYGQQAEAHPIFHRRTELLLQSVDSRALRGAEGAATTSAAAQYDAAADAADGPADSDGGGAVARPGAPQRRSAHTAPAVPRLPLPAAWASVAEPEPGADEWDSDADLCRIGSLSDMQAAVAAAGIAHRSGSARTASGSASTRGSTAASGDSLATAQLLSLSSSSSSGSEEGDSSEDGDRRPAGAGDAQRSSNAAVPRLGDVGGVGDVSSAPGAPPNTPADNSAAALHRCATLSSSSAAAAGHSPASGRDIRGSSINEDPGGQETAWLAERSGPRSPRWWPLRQKAAMAAGGAAIRRQPLMLPGGCAIFLDENDV